ncbi:MAG: sensor histidine kinase [Bacteroidota bacterium]
MLIRFIAFTFFFSMHLTVHAESLEGCIKNIRNTMVIDYNAAKKQMRELEERYIDGTPQQRFKIFIQKISLYASIGDVARVKYELNKAKTFKEIHSVDPIDLNYLNYYNAVYKGVKGDFEAYFKGVKAVFAKAGKDDFLKCKCFIDFSRYYQFKNNAPLADSNLKQAIKIAMDSKNEYLIYNTLNSAAQIYFFDNRFRDAEEFFHKSYGIALKNKWIRALQYSRSNLGEFYLFNNAQEKAKKYLDSVVLYKENVENRDLYQTFSLLQYYFEEQDNVDSAYYYLDKKSQIDDVLEDEQRIDLTTELEKDFQSEKQKALLETEKKKNSQLQLFFIFVLCFTFIGTLITVLFVRQKNRTNKLLIKQRNEINEKNKLIGNSLKEKENLLKEIHHRVKNNLQVVSSLLNLQSKNITDTEALRIIEEGKDRIFAISLIHNQLYLNHDVAFVEMSAYLEKLIDQLNRTYSSRVTKIHVEMNIEKIELSIDDAVPVGLILCELLTNAYKHAFKDIESGTINIQLLRDQQNREVVNLKFWDNGIGYLNEVELLKLNSTGVEIIEALIQQLDAKYHYLTLKEGFGIQINFSTSENPSST